ncbi:ATP-binding cassette domain-containing protein [Mycoplasmopsis verecunda]|uniref:ABC transporter n=1 Tax=Mycoplasmopsis verecunda TaxID=171291 RepID=A0A1T4LI03_9BACT|nr:ATP-binding cassette domain-containing protein [Mycoplasmopsis verecunda]WPB54602.1 ATP-binding cassette domain-containing protein [Mycoplasmopsis verecunda]SJZ54320.1 ABC transporter [Mycoplasmopsis verecunda]
MQIKIKDISHTFSPKTPWEFTALRNVSCEINDGEYIGIIGSTGSGKTTFIEHLNQLLNPSTGEIVWDFYDDVKITKKYLLSKLQNDLQQQGLELNSKEYKKQYKIGKKQITATIKSSNKRIKLLNKSLKKKVSDAVEQFKKDFTKSRKNAYENQIQFKHALITETNLFKLNFIQQSEEGKEIHRLKYIQDNIIFTKKGKGKVFNKDPKQLRKHVGIVFQFAEYQLFKATIQEDIAFGPMAFGVAKETAYQLAQESLTLVGLGPEYLDRSPFELSGGQKRRVAIAGILAMQPDFLVVDEPTAGLDPVGVNEILEILNNLNKQGKTIINVTHDLDNILKYAKRIILFKKGKIVRDDEPYDVLNDVEFLKENNLQPPHLLAFANKLRAKGIPVPKILSEDDLVNFLNSYKGGN